MFGVGDKTEEIDTAQGSRKWALLFENMQIMQTSLTDLTFTDEKGVMREDALRVWKSSSQYKAASSVVGVDPLEAYVRECMANGHRENPDAASVRIDDSTEAINGCMNKVVVVVVVWHINNHPIEARQHYVEEMWLYGSEDVRASLVLKVNSLNVAMVRDDERTEEMTKFLTTHSALIM